MVKRFCYEIRGDRFIGMKLRRCIILRYLSSVKNMTTLLQQAIAEIEQLPLEQQDAIASRFLDEIRDEQEWQIRFANTTNDQWDFMAEMVRQEIANSQTVPIKEVFPS